MIKEVRFRESDEEIQAAVARLKRVKMIHVTTFVHTCQKELCNPTSDPWNPYVFLCNYGEVHVCFPGTCQLGVRTKQGEYICPVSGLVLGVEESYTLKTEPHWKRVKEKMTPIPSQTQPIVVKTHFPSRKVIVEKCESLLEKLLFGKERARINRDTTLKRSEHAERQINREVAHITRPDVFIIQPHLEFVKSNTFEASSKTPYVILNPKEHEENVQRCIHAVCQIWEKLIGPFYGQEQLYANIAAAPFRPNVDCLTLAMLYLMKTGRGEDNLIPQNLFLSQHLPREKDIVFFHKDGARHLKPSKDLIWAFSDEAIRLKMHVVYDPFVFKPNEDTKFTPKVRGYWCKRCRHRFDLLENFQTHKPCNNDKGP